MSDSVKIENVRYVSLGQILSDDALKNFSEVSPWTFGDTDFAMVKAEKFCEYITSPYPLFNKDGKRNMIEWVEMSRDVEGICRDKDAAMFLLNMIWDYMHPTLDPFAVVKDLYIAL